MEGLLFFKKRDDNNLINNIKVKIIIHLILMRPLFRINLLKTEKQGLAGQIEEFENQIKEANQQMVEYRNVRTRCQQNIQQIQALRSRIRMSDEKIKEFQQDRTSIEEIQAIYKTKIQVEH